MKNYMLQGDDLVATTVGVLKVKDLFDRDDISLVDKNGKPSKLMSITDVACKKAYAYKTRLGTMVLPRDGFCSQQFVGGEFCKKKNNEISAGDFFLMNEMHEHRYGSIAEPRAFAIGLQVVNGVHLSVDKKDEDKVEYISRALYTSDIDYRLVCMENEYMLVIEGMSENNLLSYNESSAYNLLSGMLYLSKKLYSRSGSIENIIVIDVYTERRAKAKKIFDSYGIESVIVDGELSITKNGILELVRMGIIPYSKVVGLEQEDVEVPLAVDSILDDSDEKFGDVRLISKSSLLNDGMQVKYAYEHILERNDTMAHFYSLLTDAETIIVNNFII